MPYYEVLHVAPLTRAQKDELAIAMTRLHSKKFNTPTLFVNVGFKNMTEEEVYVAGELHQSNVVHVTTRDGPSRTQADFNSLCHDIIGIWSNIVHPSQGDKPPPTLALRAVFVTGGFLAALESGFLVPNAGEEGKWVQENMEKFKQRAREGDKAMVGLLEELQRLPEASK